MLKEGDSAPDFSLPASDNSNITLSQFSEKTVILFFYPRDNTPGCTKEACEFRDNFNLYEGCVILGISKDSIKSHNSFISKYNLPFLLLSDQDKKVLDLYGVWKEKTMYGKTSMGVERSTFIIDPDGKIKRIFRKVKVEGHSKGVIDNIT
jgi:peroxiredoxin Q/BCP